MEWYLSFSGNVTCIFIANFVNPKPYNLEVLIIWPFWRVVKRPEVLLFTRKSFMTETGSVGDMSKNVCTSTSVVSPDPLHPTASTSAIKTGEDS
jgi:hypothetical protein